MDEERAGDPSGPTGRSGPEAEEGSCGETRENVLLDVVKREFFFGHDFGDVIAEDCFQEGEIVVIGIFLGAVESFAVVVVVVVRFLFEFLFLFLLDDEPVGVGVDSGGRFFVGGGRGEVGGELLPI